MSRNDSVPVDSPEAWNEHAVAPARKALEAWDVPTDGLTPDQVLDAAQQIMELGEEPTPVLVGRIVDRIRFEAQLVAGIGGMVPEETSGQGQASRQETNPEPGPRSADCPTCIPIKVPYPSGWYLVHSAHCPTHPKVGANYVKIRPVGVRSTARQTQRLLREHADENYRSGVLAGVYLSPYRDPDGRDITAPEMGE